MLTCSEAPKFHLDKHRRRTSMCGHTPFCATERAREHVISSAGCERDSPVLSSLPGTEGRVAWGLEIRASAWTATGFGPERRTENPSPSQLSTGSPCSEQHTSQMFNSAVCKRAASQTTTQTTACSNNRHRQPYGASRGAGKRVRPDAKAAEHQEQSAGFDSDSEI